MSKKPRASLEGGAFQVFGYLLKRLLAIFLIHRDAPFASRLAIEATRSTRKKSIKSQDQRIAAFGSSYGSQPPTMKWRAQPLRPAVRPPCFAFDLPAPSEGRAQVFIRGLARSAVRRSRTHREEVVAKQTVGDAP
ncbi:hypothetical protein BLL42_18590 [Pseudomonas frederiksbergensis]|uniref:Uncharacterized protein n=1 Tax=Pseudomonas frederiksbergensis TaxID=104087 RepID=A0A1J0ENB8_9PSED|nr:hypothetical protein BLL42_18590 [Pseudomonas frederiksbergensis]